MTIQEIRQELTYVKELFATGHFDELIADLNSRTVTFQELRTACEEFVGETGTAYMEAIIRMMETVVYVTLDLGEIKVSYA